MILNRDILSQKDGRRKLVNVGMMVLLLIGTLITVVPLFNIFMYIVQQGASAIDWDFLTKLPAPVGEKGGGMGNAILGSLMMVGLASAIGIPWGVATGIYLSEYGKGKLATILRFSIDILTSIPSVVIGLFAYAMIVMKTKSFSAYAGGFALSIIMIPIIARTTEELMRLVPTHIREAGLGLGISRWKVILRIVFKGSLGGVMTGIMLAIARATGETAPLLLTALNSNFWPTDLSRPTASLPVLIYTYAISPFAEWHEKAWAAALLLMAFIFVLNLITRLLIGGKKESR
jgi:phosphate transport system permease protein